MERVLMKCWIAGISVAVLVGCSSASKVADTKATTVAEVKATPELGVLMEQAAASEKAGLKDIALRQYEEAAKLYPASKLPWVKTAQIQFDSGNHGEAIVAAQQVVSRDDKDTLAHSILSVSGLRVSTKALAYLGRQNELTGSVRSDAQSLAKVLRASLGEDVLVPSQPITPVNSASTVSESPPNRVSAPVVRAPARTTAPTRSSKAAEPVSPRGGGDPFGALK